mmetsp:Transcript_69706/g.179716  ORF Transcript_69706/g.179716 Transcript_69706/m.179716 type:complete len:478 (-) Transcript_69706:448-1881(-)
MQLATVAISATSNQRCRLVGHGAERQRRRLPRPRAAAGVGVDWLQHEMAVDLVLSLLGPCEALGGEDVQVCPELRAMLRLDLQPNQDSAHVRAMAAVVEERHIEVRGQHLQEAQQGARPLGELEAEEHLLVGERGRRAAADEVAAVRLGQLVAVKADRAEAGLRKAVQHLMLVLCTRCLEAHEDVGGVTANAVGELRHIPREDVPVQVDERAGLLRDCHRDQRLGGVGALRDEAKAVEIHVGAAGDRDEGLAFRTGLLRILLHTGHGERSGGLQQHARVEEGVLDRGADLVRGDSHHLIHAHLAQAEGLVADLPHRRAVREEAHGGQLEHLSSLEALGHGCGVACLYADHLDARPQGLEEHADARQEPTATNAAEDGVQVLPGGLREDLLADGALAGNDLHIVEGVDELAALGLHALHGGGVRLVIVVADKDDLRLLICKALHSVHLDRWRRPWHEDLCRHTELRCSKSHALRVVPS